MTTFKLNTGAQIPALGFGTWQDADAQETAVSEALKAGYRHIDTARVYGTEPAVGAAINKSGIPRNEIFLTTKIWNNKHHPDDLEQALQDSLNDLGLDYVDLLLMHWPVAFKRGSEMFPKKGDGPDVVDTDYLDTYKAMEKLISTGKVKAIGVSNFSQAEMTRLVENATVPPAVHQLEGHPWLQQRSFADWHKKNGIHVTHYSPFGNQNEIYEQGGKIGRLIEDETLVKIGEAYGKSGAQVALAWAVTEGHSVLPKSKTPQRIRDNLGGDFKLKDEDVKKIRGIDRKLRFNDSSTDFGYDLFKDLDGKK